MRSGFGAIVFISLLLILDLYFFQAIKSLSQNLTHRGRTVVSLIYWLISLATITSFLLFAFGNPEFLGRKLRTYLFALVIGMFMAKLVGIVFFFIDDVRRIIQWLINRFIFTGRNTRIAEEGISRSAFLNWMGVGLGSALFGSLVYGFSNKYNYHVKTVELSFDNLPQSFKGLKILQISDLHCGSFTNKAAVERGIQLALDQQADIIVFTGDLVNDRSTEVEPYKDVFSRLQAPLGVYSILGNHDYGDYAQWPHNGISKIQNLENLAKAHASMGWRLLNNEHIILNKENENIALIGIENWSSKARFPKHGRLDLAHKGTEHIPFKILLSHDPSHWEGEVQPKYEDIDLTLSGHTHGMQYGVDIPGFKWSPVQYVYKQWAGLYESGRQKLYVNRGFGFIGYPGRVGILPEITLIKLV